MEQTSLLDKMYKFLEDHYPDKLKPTYYGKSDNLFGEHPVSLFDTPHGWWGGNAQQPLPWDHSLRILTAIENMIANANLSVDIIALGLPSGAFLDSIIKGINRQQNENIIIRILGGHPHPNKPIPYTDVFVKDIQKQLNTKNRHLYVGIQGDMKGGVYPQSWNHGKFIAVDGKDILLGGHNYIDGVYMSLNPIFDISIKLTGPIATHAHRFSNKLWGWVNRFNRSAATYSNSLINNVAGDEKALMLPEEYLGEELKPEQGQMLVPTIHVAQPGLGILNDTGLEFANPSLSALLFALQNAEKEICISQQDLAGMGGKHDSEGWKENTNGGIPVVRIFDPLQDGEVRFFDTNILYELTRKLIQDNGPTVRIVLSNKGALAEAIVEGKHSPYSNDTFVACVYRALGWYMVKRCGKTVDEASQIIKKKVAIKTMGFRGFNHWQTGKMFFVGNHAKYWSVDDKVCYIGSHNMYPSSIDKNGFRFGHLQEWGAVFGVGTTRNIVADIRDDYFEHIFKHGRDYEFSPNFLNNLKEPSGNWP